MSPARGLAEFRSELAARGLRACVLEWWEAAEASRRDDPALWISLLPREAVLRRVEELESRGAESLPLFGIPFAVKDNIDAAGLPTTAGCPAFAYSPGEDAFVVRLLLEAGAVCLGKTNLDQFATGLAGTRSPYGTPRNPLHPELIPGGSSSGSAVAVACGLVPFSLGTDTAGSGRVPAAFCGIVGWKPTRGLLGTRGVVPACRSLDCVSLFVESAADALELLPVVARFDPADPWSRKAQRAPGGPVRRLAVPPREEMEFFGDALHEGAWEAALARLRAAGFEVVVHSCRAFFEAARLLYEGPWVAERYLAIRDILEREPGAVHPVTRSIIEAGARPSALETFAAVYRLAELRRQSESVWETADALCLPTTGTLYRRAEVEAEPLRLNSNLGYYTNFFNLLDLCGVAFPCGVREDGLPFGLTLAAPAWNDTRLLAAVVAFESGAGVRGESAGDAATLELAVFGAHMRGFPLEKRMWELGGRFVREDATAPCYRMVALDALRPGVFRVNEETRPLDLEIWELPREAVGELLAETPAPLGLGRLRLRGGGEVCGFVCEPAAADGKPDITHFGGWRRFCSRAGTEG